MASPTERRLLHFAYTSSSPTRSISLPQRRKLTNQESCATASTQGPLRKHPSLVFSPSYVAAVAMASAAPAARPSAAALLLGVLLLAVPLHSSAARVGSAVNLCGRGPPGEFCNINCLVPDPVCGANGVTYTCGCPEADCHGVPVVKRGRC